MGSLPEDFACAAIASAMRVNLPTMPSRMMSSKGTAEISIVQSLPRRQLTGAVVVSAVRQAGSRDVQRMRAYFSKSKFHVSRKSLISLERSQHA